MTRGGGVPARRAMVRWSMRMFRREWRRQLLTLILLSAAVAGSVFAVAASYHTAPTNDATFGSARHVIRFDGGDPQALAERTAAAQRWFGTIEVIGHRYVPVPGLFDPIDIRAQRTAGPYGGPMLALRQGRYPRDAGEIALTAAVAAALRTGPGATVDLDGRARVVSGLIENPADLHDQFAVVDPAAADPPQSVTVLVGGSHASLEAFRDTLTGAVVRESRPTEEGAVAALITMALTTIGLLLVSLVAAAGFVVTAQRRMRQLGLLAAIGATRRHLRLVMLANGAIIGAIAALVGTTVGLAVWFAVAGTVENAAGHRIDRLDLPWLVLAAGMLLAVLTAVAAAWWPSRVVSHTPVMQALSARPSPPRRSRRSAVVAGLVTIAGLAALYASKGSSPALIIGGIAWTVTGMLLLGPPAIRLLAAARRPLPVAVRLALTDLGRYQARSGAALAAISLAVALAVAVVAGSAAGESISRRDTGLGNLAGNQLIVRIGTPEPNLVERTPAELAAFRAGADRITEALGGSPAATDLTMAVSAATVTADNGKSAHPAVELGVEHDGRDGLASYPAFVATNELLQLYGLHNADLAPDTDVVSVRKEELKIVAPTPGDPKGKFPTAMTQVVPRLDYASLPSSLLTAAAVQRHQWRPVLVGWLIQAGGPPTERQLAAVQDIAAATGLTVESRREQASLSSLRTAATAAGALLALAILAGTVGLIRGEGAADLRSLTAIGAPRRTRRILTAATAGALALLGAILGSACAYLAIAAILRQQLDMLTDVPVAHLAAIAGGIPILATAAAWLVAGTRPTTFARRALD